MLLTVAKWLSSQTSGSRDFSSWLVVTPGGASQRRLMQRLLDQSGGALTPPKMVTLGQLYEQLYDLNRVAKGYRFAEMIEVELAWAEALSRAGRTALEVLTPDPPSDKEFASRLTLSRRFVAISQELAAWCVTWTQVRDVAIAAGGRPERWDLLEALEVEVDHILEQQGLIRRDVARARACEQNDYVIPENLLLVAAVDLNTRIRVMLEAVAAASRVHVWIHAPDCEDAGFANDGTLDVDYWFAQPMPFADADLRIADQPSDQARAVVDALSSLSSTQTVATSEIVVSLTDEALLGPVRRTLETTRDQNGESIRTRYAAGRSLAMSRPVVFLRLLARLASDARLDRLSWLVRHPDFRENVDGPAILDQYISVHLIHRWSPTTEPMRQARNLEDVETVYRAAAELLPRDLGLQAERCVTDWLEIIEAMLLKVYGDREMSRLADRDRLTLEGLTAIVAAMDRLRGIDQRHNEQLSSLLPELTFTQVLSLVADMAESGSAPERGDEGAIEITGFLETALDDRRFAVVVGFNEGMLPSSVVSDAFLPDSVRRTLGMMDNRRRFARDALLMRTLIESHERVFWIAGRRSEVGDPLKPSRLMLQCEHDVMLGRLKRFYGSSEIEDEHPSPLVNGNGSNFIPANIPLPDVDSLALERLCQNLPVTALSLYVSCPYRFYLTHLRKLRRFDDETREMQPLAFGSLIHDVLKGFGRGPAVASSDADEIAHDLAVRLDEQMRRQYRGDESVVLRVQREHALRRLENFARWQADQVAQGWLIEPELVERKATLALEGDVTLVGKLDRVDRHVDTGAWRVIDYKTGDSPATPKDHTRGRKTNKTWVKFQLPVYRAMLQALGYTGDISTGYIAFSKKMDSNLLQSATWDAADYGAAMLAAGEVAMQIKSGVFWPPTSDLLNDDFSVLTLEGVWGRSLALAAEGDS